MAEETIQILRVETGEAVKSVNDLRENVKILKERLGDLEIGTEEYQNTLEELKINQNAVKDAMYATSSSMEDLAESATGTSNSYNSLVHRMAALKEELRATDVSTEQGKQRFKELAGEINKVNDTLKEMDALQGNFQRNVGNYPGLMKNFSGSIDALDKGIKATSGDLGQLKGGFDALATNPAFAILGIAVATFAALADRVRENETALGSMHKAGMSLEPVFNILANVVEKLAGWLSIAIDYFVDLFDSSKNTFKGIISGAIGVGNVIVQALLTPIRTVIAAVKGLGEAFSKVIEGEFTEAGKIAERSWEDIKGAFEKGFNFSGNFEEGIKVGESFIEGLTAPPVKRKAKKAGSTLVKSIMDGVINGLDDVFDDLEKEVEDGIAKAFKEQDESNKIAQNALRNRLNNLDKAARQQLELNSILVEDEREKAEKAYQIQKDANERRLQVLKDFAAKALERGDVDAYIELDQERADLEVEIENNALKEKKRLRELDAKDAKEKAKQQIDIMKNVASATSSILGSIADMYESDQKNSERNANKIKGLRIAAATIDTISGAVGAFMQAAATIPPPLGQVIGGIQAAAITASGMAQIAKMRSTQMNGSSVSMPNFSAPATASAPSLDFDIPQVRSLNSDTEEERLNQMASDQRVVLVMSDLEVAQNQRQVQIGESSF